MKNFADRLTDRIKQLNNPTVMGLDPMLSYIPDYLLTEWRNEVPNNMQQASAMAIFDYNRLLIDSVCDIVPAIKPQFAYYEMYGIHGIMALIKTIKYAQDKGMLVIADAKRNDIGSTASAYAEAILGQTKIIDDTTPAMFNADCVTVNGYLGLDGIKPFLDVSERVGKGIFVLVRTSNPSAGDIQDLELKDGKTVYPACRRWRPRRPAGFPRPLCRGE